MSDAPFKVITEYDDGFESIKEFKSKDEAKSFFQNVDERDIRFSAVFEYKDGTQEEIARKEGKQRK